MILYFLFFCEQSWELLFPRGQRKICLRLVLFLLSAIGTMPQKATKAAHPLTRSCCPPHPAQPRPAALWLPCAHSLWAARGTSWSWSWSAFWSWSCFLGWRSRVLWGLAAAGGGGLLFQHLPRTRTHPDHAWCAHGILQLAVFLHLNYYYFLLIVIRSSFSI